jgi:hypothetical protein
LLENFPFLAPGVVYESSAILSPQQKAVVDKLKKVSDLSTFWESELTVHASGSRTGMATTSARVDPATTHVVIYSPVLSRTSCLSLAKTSQRRKSLWFKVSVFHRSFSA